MQEEYNERLDTPEFDQSTKYFFVFPNENMAGLKVIQLELGEVTEEGVELPRFTFFLTENMNE